MAATRLPDVPLPVFQGTVAGLASLVIVVVRPQSVGWPASLGLDLVTGTLCCLAILVQARLVMPPGLRPELGSLALPAAALVALAVVAAGAGSVTVGAVAVVVTAAVVALVPHLHALRLAGRDGLGVRLGLDVAATVTAVPLALVGAAGSLAPPWRALVVFAGSGALSLDALRGEAGRLRGGLATGLAGGVGAGVAGGALLTQRAPTQAAGATALLLLWYGLRGVAAAGLRRGPWSWLSGVEYVAVAGGAAYLLVRGGLPGQ